MNLKKSGQHTNRFFSCNVSALIRSGIKVGIQNALMAVKENAIDAVTAYLTEEVKIDTTNVFTTSL